MAANRTAGGHLLERQLQFLQRADGAACLLLPTRRTVAALPAVVCLSRHTAAS